MIKLTWINVLKQAPDHAPSDDLKERQTFWHNMLTKINWPNLLHQIGIGDLFSAALHKNILLGDAILDGAPEDHGGVFFIQLHHAADAIHVLARHHGRAGTAEGVDDHGVLLGRVPDGVTQQVERLAGRMVGVALRFGEVPDGRLLAVGVPRMLAVLQETVHNRLMLPLIIRAAQHQRILHPDTASGEVEPGVDESPAEVQAFRVRVEDVGRAAFLEVNL